MPNLRIVELCSKRPYAENEEARAHLASLLEAGDALEDLTLYRCAIHGDQWHVGHRHRRQRQTRRAGCLVLD